MWGLRHGQSEPHGARTVSNAVQPQNSLINRVVAASIQRNTDTAGVPCPVNTAKRLQEMAKPGQILMNESTFHQLKDKVIARPLGITPLKGKSRSESLFELLGLKHVDDLITKSEGTKE